MVQQKNQPFNPIRPQTMFECVQEHFVDLRHVKQGRTCISGLNALYRGTEGLKMVSQRNQLFNSIRPQTMFESVQEHFTDLRHLKQGRTCISGLNALYRGIEGSKMVQQRDQPFNPIRPQAMFESLQEHSFPQPLTRQTRKNYYLGPECTISGYPRFENGLASKPTILPHQTPSDV